MPTEMSTLAKGVEIQSSLCWSWGDGSVVNCIYQAKRGPEFESPEPK